MPGDPNNLISEHDLYDDFFDSFDETEDFDDLESECFRCGEPADGECCCCGEPLCHMHFELGAGFCPACPTEEFMNREYHEE